MPLRSISLLSLLGSLGLLAGAGCSRASAQARAALERESGGYCRHVEGVAASRAALLYVPHARVTAGTARNLEAQAGAEEGDAGDDVRLRLLAGLEYDLIDVFRAATLEAHAGSSCAAYRAELELRETLEPLMELESRAALAERLKVLDEAMPEAERFVRTIEAEVAAGQATQAELLALERELDALDAERARVRLLFDSLPEESTPIDSAGLERKLARFVDAEDDVERAEARLRTLEAFSLALRGGYDHVFGEDLEPPVYGMVTVSYALGGLAQSSADARAAAGRRTWLRARAERALGEREAALRRLSATLAAERSRLAAVERRLTSLEQRQRTLAAISEGRAREYQRALWMELVRVRADRAYLSRHVEDLATLASTAGGAEP